jgi:hypothetical protein
LSDSEQQAINRLNQLIEAETTTPILMPNFPNSPFPPGTLVRQGSVSELGQALTQARDELLGAIGALKPGEKSVAIQTAVNAINAIGDQNYANTSAMNAPGGTYTGNKCNVFVGMAISTASNASLGSKNGYPMDNGVFPAANHLGDPRDIQKLNNLGVVTDGPRIGDIVAYRNPNASPSNVGHATVYIGGGAVVYAGGANTPPGVPKAMTLKSTDASFSKFSRAVRRYTGK